MPFDSDPNGAARDLARVTAQFNGFPAGWGQREIQAQPQPPRQPGTATTAIIRKRIYLGVISPPRANPLNFNGDYPANNRT